MRTLLSLGRFLPLVVALPLAVWLAHGGGMAVKAGPDARKVVGPHDPQKGCIRCHENEIKAWQKSHHHASLDLIAESDKAEEILEALGIDDDPSEVKRCQDCHVTMQADRGEATPEWGVSCESCHGAAAGWVDVHGNYGPGVDQPAQESAAHKAERLRVSEAAGMIRPARLYRLAWNCFSCHTVPDEELVAKGGHPAGSPGFDLLTWSQGEVRHSFLHGKANTAATPARRRVLHVVGRLVDLEVSTRALAKATRPGRYADAMIARIRTAKAVLGKLRAALGDASAGRGLAAALGALPEAHLKHGNGAALKVIADRLRQVGMKFADKFATGDALAAIDPLLPTGQQGAVYTR